LGLRDVTQIIGGFEEVLNTDDRLKGVFDLIYIDGNHRYEPTMEYFEYALAHAHEDSFIIFDDIHWSDGMEKAWNAIKSSPKISVSIDLFQFGIICKKSTQRKQHFTLKY
jgi:predicted O-methyltransferase YrrM